MIPIRVGSVANAEIAGAFDWYLARSPRAARRFLDALDEAMTRIRHNPEASPVIRGRLRRVLLPRYPYAVYYKAYAREISVVGVIHGHRHPDAWLKRA